MADVDHHFRADMFLLHLHQQVGASRQQPGAVAMLGQQSKRFVQRRWLDIFELVLEEVRIGHGLGLAILAHG